MKKSVPHIVAIVVAFIFLVVAMTATRGDLGTFWIYLILGGAYGSVLYVWKHSKSIDIASDRSIELARQVATKDAAEKKGRTPCKICY